MGERKVLNKYYPPDFDPTKLPKGKRVRSEEKQMKVRMMLPMSVRCNTCGTFMYKGTKFNTRMEDVKGENYLGIKIFRFYYRCTHCSAEFCMKTDPKTADYVVEAGATRNYEPWRDQERAKVDAVAQREEEERGNAMKALENRTLDSKREMDILSALDEMKSLKARHATIDTETALAALKRSATQREADLDEEDEQAVRQMLLQRAGFVRRLSDSEGEEEGRSGSGGAGPSGAGTASATAGRPATGGEARAPEGAGGGGGERRGKRKLGALGGPLPVAAAMWGDDGEEGEEGGGEDGTTMAGGGRERGGAGASAAGAAAGSEEQEAGGGGAAAVEGGGTDARQPAQQLQQVQQESGAGAAAAATGKPKKPASAAAQPPPLPGFSVRARPVAVVVKKKTEAQQPSQQPSQQQQQEQQQQGAAAKKEGEEGGGGLAGLLGYGSGSGSESD